MTFTLLEMAWYITIHDHDNSVTRHGLASHVTKFAGQSFRLRAEFGVAFAQRKSCWRSQQSASASKSKSKGQGEGPNSGIVLAGK